MTSTPDPSRILDIATSYMGAKLLFAASRTGLFHALADGPLDADELARRTGTPSVVARILADGMAAQGLVNRDGGRYSLPADARAYLTGDHAALDLGPYLTFLDEISYGHWQQFDATVRTGEPGDLGMDDDRWATFLAGVMAYNRLHARMLAQHVDLTPYRRLLDLGGLSSAFSIEAMRANEQLHATFVFDPKAVDTVTADVTAAGVDDRSVVIGEPTATAEPAGEFDLIMVNHVIHRFSPEQNVEILRRARAAATPGARLLLLDFYLDDDQHQRSIDALHAGEYLVIDGTVVYPEADVRGWLAQTGWRATGMTPLPGSPRVLHADAA
ncbi:methyltransferase domain-containing protein [Actinobacteria bacterium YIM 96077]|uniref:Polyketide biosynthesis methyltransferase n=1 Tax=Phytoactinopolyspora halophila TaxID=1981511 RepID=A0A329QJZ4_9ACTN|nr:methyltransferase [Phytoactinopolyspora halophila]AYY15323.1 methyltransferase domain-containing protein [Actinobacteria bacterium YIM 96077]RAW12593.1 polyketide biosynthesis methyltransferase [Phytoactinopolyspora halophila]